MSSGHLLLLCAKRAATTKIDLFAYLRSWSGVLPKNAESLRDSDALMRVAVPQASRPRWAAWSFYFCRNCGLYALFQILLSVFQTLQLVLFLCKPYLSSFLFGSELFKGFRFCHCAWPPFLKMGIKKAVTFLRITTSQRSDFRYSVFVFSSANCKCTIS